MEFGTDQMGTVAHDFQTVPDLKVSCILNWKATTIVFNLQRDGFV